MVDILGKTFQFLKKLDKDQQRIHSQGLPESDITEGDRGDLIIKGMDETGVDALNKAIKDTGYKGPGLNLERIALIFKEQGGEQTVDLTSMFANIKEQNKELFAYLRRPTQTMEMLIAMAQETGYREIVYKFLNRKTGEITYGKIPPYSVVVPGSLPDKNNPAAPSLYCAVIIKQVDEKTRSKTSVNDLLRE